MAFDSYFYARFFLSCIKCRISLYIRSSRFVSAGLNYLCESRLDREALCHESEGEEEQLHDYRPSTNLSFCLKMFLSSPRVDSIFSRENWFSPSVEAASALTSQGENSLMPVLYSAQNLTSSEYLSHSFFVFSWRSVTYLVILLSSSLNSWASAGTLSP